MFKNMTLSPTWSLFFLFVIVTAEITTGTKYQVSNNQIISYNDIEKIRIILKTFHLFGLERSFDTYLRDNENLTVSDLNHLIQMVLEKTEALSDKCHTHFLNLAGEIFQEIGKGNFKDLLKWFLSSSDVGKYADSWAKIPTRILSGHLRWNGAFEECNSIPGAHYCIADMIVLNQTQIPGQFGTCVPKDCTPKDVYHLLNLTKPVLQVFIEFPSHGRFAVDKDGPPVLCNDKRNLPSDLIAYIVLCSVLGFLCFLGTLTETLQDIFTPDRLIPSPFYNSKEENLEEVSVSESVSSQKIVNNSREDLSFTRFGTDSESVVFTRGNKLTNFLICFSLLKNTKALFNTKIARGTITSINGIRAISMTWVILGHIYFFGVLTTPDNLNSATEINHRFSYQVIANAYVSVDSFFFLSGFLVAYITLRKMDKANGKLPFFKFILHRFIRLTPSYAFAIFTLTSLYPQTLNSPEGIITRASKNDACKKYWWTNILYINNFYPEQLMSECLGWSWYLANDMQFFIISPLFLFIMYRYKLKGAVIAIGAGILICVVTTATIVGVNDLPALLSISYLSKTPLEIRGKVGQYGNEIYIKPYTRIAPYLVGLLLGYIISRKIYLTRKPSFLIGLVGWGIATAIGVAVIYGPYSVFKSDGASPFNKAENIFYASLSRLAWALALAWVVYACQYRMGGFINHFLSWNVWIPLSRLTYGAYLLHPIVLDYYYKTSDNPWHFQDDTSIFRFLSVTVVSYSLAFVMALMIDLPVYNVESQLIKN